MKAVYGIIILLIAAIVYLVYTTWDARTYLTGIWSATDAFLKTAGIGAMVLHINKTRDGGHLVMIADDNEGILFDADIKIKWECSFIPARSPEFTRIASIDTGDHVIFSNRVKFVMNKDFDLKIEGTNGVLYADLYKV